MSAEYKPIACDIYDIFEVAAMRKKRLILTVENKEQEILITDVYAKGTEEFLDGIDPATNASLHIRLDKIQKVFDPAENKSYIPIQCS